MVDLDRLAVDRELDRRALHRRRQSRGVACVHRFLVRLVDRAVALRHPERRQRRREGVARVAQRDPVLRAPWPGDRGLDAREIELDDLRVRRLLLGVVPEPVLLAVGLDERDLVLAAAGEPEVAERLVVDGEEPARRAVFGRHVPDRRPVGERQACQAVAEVLDELPDDAGLAQDLGDREDEVGRGRALRKRTVEPEADDLRHEHRDRLTEHRSLGLDPADTPTEHPEPVDHRRVRVGADDGVGIRLAVALLDHPGEELEVHLVADAGVRRHGLEVREGTLPPAEEGIALPVAAELQRRVPLDRESRCEVVDLDGVVDHELDRDQRVDLLRVAAKVGHRGAHRGQVDDGRHAGEVL